MIRTRHTSLKKKYLQQLIRPLTFFKGKMELAELSFRVTAQAEKKTTNSLDCLRAKKEMKLRLPPLFTAN